MNALEVRCTFCQFRTLLAICKRNAVTGQLFVHVRRVRNGKPDVDVIVEDPTIVRVCCRDCGRWQTIRVRRVENQPSVRLVTEPLPVGLAV